MSPAPTATLPPLHPRAAELIGLLALEPHVEGGRFRRIYQSALASSQPERPAATAIHYLLAAGEISRWHCVDADEVWHFLEGEPVELLCFDPKHDAISRHLLAPAAPAADPVIVVAAGTWQAARPLGAYALVGCTVAPGFDYGGYRLLDQAPEITARLARVAPDTLDLA